MYLMNLIKGSLMADNSFLTDEEGKSFVTRVVNGLLEKVDKL